MKFSVELAEDSPFAARAFIAGKDSLTMAQDNILALDHDTFSAALRKSPMQQAKLAGLRRNAAVSLDNIEAAANHATGDAAAHGVRAPLTSHRA